MDPVNPKIINISSHHLSEGEKSVLLKGLKFCPAPKDFDTISHKNDNFQFCRQLRQAEYFHGIDNQEESIVKGKSNFVPPSGRNDFLDKIITSILNIPTPTKKNKCKWNITHLERQAIESLRKCEDIVIKEADKGSTVVIMDRSYYVEMTDLLLGNTSNYELVDPDCDAKLMKAIEKIISKNATMLTDGEIKFLTKFEYKTSNLYCLPKVHKSEIISHAISIQKSEIVSVNSPPDLSLRPIVAGPACPTHRLSHFLDLILRPLVSEVKANVRDTVDFLGRLPKTLEENYKMATFDVENLYGNITHEIGLEAISYWLNRFPLLNERISNDFILEALCLILRNNNFNFQGKFYRQLRGTAMGTKVAPVYATLTLGFLELSLYNTINTNYGPLAGNLFLNNYFRYLDDIFLIFDQNLLPVDDLCIIFNELNPDLNFKLETLGDEINFLDVKVKVEDCVITTDIFYKATDSKQYLNFFSHHPHHTKVALPYNLSRRICTIVSSNEIRKGRLEEMKRYLTNCNYPEKLIDDSIKKALTLNRTELIKSVPSNSTQDSNLASIVHVSTFHSNYSSNNQILHSHFNQLKENGTTSEIFSNKKLLLSKRQPPNLKSLLTKAQLQSTVTGGVYSCGNARCQLCNILLTGPSIKFKPTNFHFFI